MIRISFQDDPLIKRIKVQTFLHMQMRYAYFEKLITVDFVVHAFVEFVYHFAGVKDHFFVTVL